MAGPTYSTIIAQLTNKIDSLTQSFLHNGYQALADALKQPLAGLCVLLIILLGYGILQGLIKMPLDALFKAALRIGAVYLFAMHWGFFSQYLVKLFINSASELGAVVMKAALVEGGINQGLQAVLTEVIRVGAWTADKASLKHWAPLFTALMIYLSGLAVIGLALFEVIVAKLMLSICLCTAPLFFCFVLFEQTKGFFDRWIGVLVGFSLVLIFVSCVVGLCMHLIHWTMGDHYATHAVNITAVDWIPIFFVACLCVMLLLEVTSIAKSIGGSCSTGSGSAMVGGFIGGALGASARSKGVKERAKGVAKKLIPASLIAHYGQMQGTSQVDPLNHFRQSQ